MKNAIRQILLWLSALSILSPSASPAQRAAATPVDAKVRVFVLTDIGNEPDDSESFVRFLLYANEFDIEGLVATTSTWQREKVQPQLLRERVAAYAKVLPNLRRHASGYPDAEQLMAAIHRGLPLYGMAGVGEGKDSEGSQRLIETVDRPDQRPIYVPVWGGAAVLAQALWKVRATRTPEQVRTFVDKLRVYSISDQDDAGPWARRAFPDLFWIVSTHGWGQYGMATWPGISADLNLPAKWPASETVTNDWLAAHVHRGPLGTLYPPHKFLMEGDTPSFLYLLRNGLGDPEHPEWGSWGGRYLPVYEDAGQRGDAQDSYLDENGTRWSGNQTTIYRWRRAFQNDFAARIGWTLSPDTRAANHNPAVVLNGVAGTAPVLLSAKAGSTVRLSAAGTRDPDGDRLTYRWWQYAESSGSPGMMTPTLRIDGASASEASFVAVPFAASAANVPRPKEPLTLHVILEVTDAGTPALTSYRRAIVRVEP